MLVLVRLVLDDQPGALASAAAAIAEAGGNIRGIDVVDNDDTSVVDDFVVQLPDADTRPLRDRLALLPGVTVDHLAVTTGTELHREIELISSLATNDQSLSLLSRLVPAMLRCDWAIVISGAGSGISVTHASSQGPRVRWSQLPWFPLEGPMVFSGSQSWVPRSLGCTDTGSLAASPIDAQTSVLVCRNEGPRFRPKELTRLAQICQLAGRLLDKAPSARAGDAEVRLWAV